MKIATLKPVYQKTFPIVVFVFSLGINSYAQFYYNDIVSGKQSQQAYLSIKNSKVNSVSAECFDENNERNDDFIFERNILNSGDRIKTILHLPHLDTTYSVSIYADNLLQTTTDSSGTIITKTDYTYNNDNILSLLKISTDDNFMEVQNEELHQWFYANGKPDKMLRIKDKTDTTTVSFITDDAGNTVEEIWKKKNRTIEHYYYYYNSSNQLTDIVRYNEMAKQLLPDFLIEYAADGNVSALTQVPAGSSDYTTWQYVYDASGLKQNDVLFSKQKEIIGRISYYYR